MKCIFQHFFSKQSILCYICMIEQSFCLRKFDFGAKFGQKYLFLPIFGRKSQFSGLCNKISLKAEWCWFIVSNSVYISPTVHCASTNRPNRPNRPFILRSSLFILRSSLHQYTLCQPCQLCQPCRYNKIQIYNKQIYNKIQQIQQNTTKLTYSKSSYLL